MADLIALVTLGLQCSLLVFAANLWLGSTLPFSGIGIAFAVLAVIGMLLLASKEALANREEMENSRSALGRVGDRVLRSRSPDSSVEWSS